MRKKLLSLLSLGLLAGACAFAQTSPVFLPKGDFGGQDANVQTFIPGTGDYTLEVEGTVGTPIVVKGAKYTYTPTTNGTVRFVKSGDKVYIYEAATFIGEATVEDAGETIYPEIYLDVTDNADDKTGIYSAANLLSNPGFEKLGAAVGSDYEAVNWACNGYTYGSKSRARKNVAEFSGYEGAVTFMMHGYGNPAEYIAQTFTGLKSNTSYKIQFTTWSHNNTSNGKYDVKVGTSAGDGSVASKEINTGNSGYVKTDQNVTFTTGNIDESAEYVFSITRKSTAISHFDRMTLVEATFEPKGIKGVSSAKYLANKTYAPEGVVFGEDVDATNMIVNPYFDKSFDGWTNVNFAIQNGNDEFPNKPYAEKWQNSYNSYPSNTSISQEIELPSGKYTLAAFVVGRDLKTQLFVSKDGVNIAELNLDNVIKETKALEFDLTKDAKVKIGYKYTGVSEAPTGTDGWMAIDDWALTYVRALTQAELDAALTNAKNNLIDRINETKANTTLAEAIEKLNAAIVAVNAVADESEIADVTEVVSKAIAFAENAEKYAGATLTNPVKVELGAWKQDGSVQNYCSTFTTPGKNGVNTEYEGEFTESWNPSAVAGRRFYQALTDMPAGLYGLQTVLFASASDVVYLYVGESTETLSYAEGEYNAQLKTLVGSPVDNTLEIGIKQDDASSNWIAFSSDIKLLYFGTETTAEAITNELNPDLTDLNAAIAAADAKTLGFDADEYAPYNNIEALRTLKNAKNAKGLTVTEAANILAALEAATWTANTEEVNAIYDGTFELADADVMPAGWWENAGWNSRVFAFDEEDENYDNLGALVDNDGVRKALYITWGKNSGGFVQYGGDDYAMPLKGGVEYVISYDMAIWGVNGTPTMTAPLRKTINVKNIADGGIIYTHVNETFTLDADGEVTFRIFMEGGDSNKGNIVLSNIKIMRAATLADTKATGFYAHNVVLTEATGFTAADVYTAENVELTREYNANAENWNTICLPFAVENVEATFGVGTKAAVLDNVTESTVEFKTVDALEAGKPYIIRNVANTTIVASDVKVVKDPVEIDANEYAMIGEFVATSISGGEYFISNNAFYFADKEITVRAFRAYLKEQSNKNAKPAMRVVVDGEESGIATIVGDELIIDNGEMFNVMGQKVDSNYKGLIIRNGQKFINK